MKSFDKQNLKALRIDIDKSLAEVNKKHGIALSIGNIRFDTNTFTTKMTAVIVDAKDAKAGLNPKEVKYKTALEQYGSLYNLSGRKHGDRFTMPGSKVPYRLVGLDMGRKKNIVVIENLNTKKEFICNEFQIGRVIWSK